jgi:hypothetical protein
MCCTPGTYLSDTQDSSDRDTPENERDTEKNGLDVRILSGYILLVITVGCGAAWMQKRKAERPGKAQDVGAGFLAARTLAWPIIGLSLFSPTISSVHIVALQMDSAV